MGELFSHHEVFLYVCSFSWSTVTESTSFCLIIYVYFRPQIQNCKVSVFSSGKTKLCCLLLYLLQKIYSDMLTTDLICKSPFKLYKITMQLIS